MKVKLSLHNSAFIRKPSGKEIARISKEIAKSQCIADIQEIAVKIGEEGHTFCPAVFREGERNEDNVIEMQLFALDFDEEAVFDDIKERAYQYHLPIAFAYETFSSTSKMPRFRVVFLNDVPVTDNHAAKIMILMLLTIFDKADGACKALCNMFFGGKGLIGTVKEEYINIIDLSASYQRYIFETQPKNYTRNIEQFAKDNHIVCINNCLQIFGVHENGSLEDFSVGDLYINKSIVGFPSNNPKYYIVNTRYHTYVRRLSETSYEPLRMNMSEIEKRCQLYRDFVKEVHIPHCERFLLLTNLLHIMGGKKKFLAVIDKKKYDRAEWRFYAKYAKDRGYKPQMCEGNCPYADRCDHAVNMVHTVKQNNKIVRIQEELPYYKVAEVYDFIEKNLWEAAKSTGQGIYIIPAQTAIGKTEAYCNLVSQEIDQRFLIAVPTNLLKREVGERLKRKGVEVEIAMSLDEMNIEEGLKSKIQFYYQTGLGDHVIRLLRDYIDNNINVDIPDIQWTVDQCKQYLKINNNMEKHRVLVMTHARLLTLSSDFIRQFTVIVDEDILSTIFKNTRTVPIETIYKVFDSEQCPDMLKVRLCQIIHAPNKGYGKFHEIQYSNKLSEKELEDLGVYDNVNEILAASVFEKEDGNIHYFIPQTLMEGKYIILSATIDGDLYRRYFPGRVVKEYPYHRAKYQGRLKQLTAYSMSRQCIQDHKKELEVLLNQYQGMFKLITFMKFKKEFGGTEIHFGNAEGVDWLNGEDVMVIGTPHSTEFVYKLIGLHLGIGIEGETLSVRRIQYKEHEFNFMTYKNVELRRLQTFFIGKELEQCIGRARLLRNDCTVLVFSNFPCEQAELIQDDYLKETDREKLIKACSPDMAGEL